MLLTCGYIGKSYGYYHYIQNVTLNNSGWTSVKILFDNKVIAEYVNKNKELKFEMVGDNSYNIIFKINDNIIKTDRHLFKIDLDVSNTNDDFYKYEEGLIVDH